jgi:predicted TIM-barrel fold metal-dependent hydrolase
MYTSPKHIIDIHSHVFNLRYIPIKGLARSKVSGPIGNAVAYLLNEMTQSSYPEVTYPEKTLDSINKKESVGDHAEALWLLFSIKMLEKTSQLEKTYDFSAIGETANAFENDEFIKSLTHIVGEYNEEHPDSSIACDDISTALMSSSDTEKDLKDFFNILKKPIKWAFKKFARILDKAKVFGDDVSDMLEFLYAMTKDEKSMFHKLVREYGNHDVALYVHYMMDMQYGCKGEIPPYYPFFPDQCEKMSCLASDSQSKLIGFSAFDPNRPNWSEIYDKSLSLGFIGFKFYPSMGFQPIGNEDPEIEQRVSDFLLRCAKDNVPIVTHCTPNGFQFQDGDGLKAHPIHWKNRLEQNGYEHLKVSFCHSGGGNQTNQGLTSPGWYASNKDEWDETDNFAKIVVELCCNYENVYCDMSYLLKVYEQTAEGQNIQKTFEKIFLEQLQTKDFSGKVMFGSDWNMPNIIDENDSYLNYFIKLFSRDEFKQFKELFFWQNGLNFLDFPRYFERAESLDICDQHVLDYLQGMKQKVALFTEN